MLATTRQARRGAWWAVLAVGIGLIAAPAVFQMFDRAPKGGDMIAAFEPYMTPAEIQKFQGYMTEIDAAVTETQQDVVPAVGGADPLADAPSVATLVDEWPGIDADMSDMLATMSADIDNYEAVAALPPFDLFPWFFVVPGVLLAGVAGYVLVRRPQRATAARWLVGVVGVGLVLAPVAFQMFERAPKGGEMIDDFRPLMTRPRVENIQGYFVTLGAGEGQLRNDLVPAAVAAGAAESDFPAVTAFSEDWQAIVTDFAPMIGVMSDNVVNFEAVDALPDFPLFPWFFVIPGVLVAGLAAVALWSRPRSSDADDEATDDRAIDVGPPESDDASSPPNSPALSGKESS